MLKCAPPAKVWGLRIAACKSPSLAAVFPTARCCIACCSNAQLDPFSHWIPFHTLRLAVLPRPPTTIAFLATAQNTASKAQDEVSSPQPSPPLLPVSSEYIKYDTHHVRRGGRNPPPFF